MSRVEQLQQQIRDFEAQYATAQAHALSLLEHGRTYSFQVHDHFKPHFQTTDNDLHSLLASVDSVIQAEWLLAQWQGWNAQSALVQTMLRFGTTKESRSQGQFAFPALVPFIGGNRTIIIQSRGQSHQAGERLLQSLLVRTALMLPHQASYTLLDPSGNGSAYPMRRQLPLVQPNGDDVARDIDQVINDIRRKIETYLDAETTSFDQIPEDIRINERYHFVFAADFPNKYDRRAIEKLQSAATTGPQAGTYVFIHHHLDHELPRDISMDGFNNAFFINAAEAQVTVERGTTSYAVVPDSAPPADVQKLVFDGLANTKPKEGIIPWSDVAGGAPAQWWQAQSTRLIEVPIGKRGGSELLRIWFGEDAEGRPCAHGVLGAMTGSGKSSLYHSLILGLTTRYSPEELRLYLIDGKYGVEFKPYQHLPHAEVVSLHTSAELSRSVLAELLEEMGRRNAIFTRHGVTGVAGYRDKGQPDGAMPRLLLIVDEYQQLFENDRDGIASRLLNQLSAQGRNVGIHMLLASQRYGAAGMLNQTAIFGNIHLRMAMQMAEADIRALTEFGPRGKGLILATCNLPGKIVLNDRAGDDNANVAGKAVYLKDVDRDAVIEQLIQKAQTLPAASLPRRVVFNGESQPDLLDNPVVRSLIKRQTWPTTGEIDLMARQPLDAGGWNIADWHAAERPAIAWIGQEFNVRGQAALVLRRRTGEHVAVVGNINVARYGMLVGLLASLAVQSTPQTTRFVLIDRAISGAEWSDTLQTACDQMLRPAGFTVGFNKKEAAVPGMLDMLLTELDKRRSLPEDDVLQQQSVYLLITEIDRIEALRRTNDGYGLVDSPMGEKLKRLYTEGAAYGIHVILSTSGVRALMNVVDEKRGLIAFNHRIALQMSEDESFTFVRNRKAAVLQTEGPRPVCGVYLDMERDRTVRFKPYSLETDPDSPEGSLPEQMTRIGQSLSQRRS